MQNACWVIHCAIGIHRRRESVVPEPLSYLAGKARPHQQHLLAGSYPESRPSRLYFRPELHRFSSFYVAKVRISEDNTKQKRLFVFIVEQKNLLQGRKVRKKNETHQLLAGGFRPSPNFPPKFPYPRSSNPFSCIFSFFFIQVSNIFRIFAV